MAEALNLTRLSQELSPWINHLFLSFFLTQTWACVMCKLCFCVCVLISYLGSLWMSSFTWQPADRLRTPWNRGICISHLERCSSSGCKLHLACTCIGVHLKILKKYEHQNASSVASRMSHINKIQKIWSPIDLRQTHEYTCMSSFMWFHMCIHPCKYSHMCVWLWVWVCVCVCALYVCIIDKRCTLSVCNHTFS